MPRSWVAEAERPDSRRTIRRPGVVEVRSAAELGAYADEWQGLVDEALEPNVFHEPWMMLPAIESYGRGRDLRFVLVFTPGDGPPTGPAVLAGFFPLELRRTYQRIPVSTLALWRYPHCFLGTPLLRRSSAEACLETFFDWALQSSHPWRLLELGRVSGEGSFHRLLLEQIGKRGLFAYRAESYVRALFEPAEDADVYLQRSLPGKKRKELRRQINRLTELGRVEFDELDGEGDPAPWIEQFLALEASGWKGEEGTALLSSEEDRRFFRSIAREAFDRGALSMLALRLDGAPIAMKCNVEAGDGAFALKVAFDEAYARFSPGVALEIESIRRMHDQRSPPVDGLLRRAASLDDRSAVDRAPVDRDPGVVGERACRRLPGLCPSRPALAAAQGMARRPRAHQRRPGWRLTMSLPLASFSPVARPDRRRRPRCSSSTATKSAASSRASRFASATGWPVTRCSRCRG